METMENDDSKEIEEQPPFESLQLTRNSKGYGYKILISEINIERLSKINQEMLAKFGGKR